MAWKWGPSLLGLGATPMQGAENVRLLGVQLEVASLHPTTASSS